MLPWRRILALSSRPLSRALLVRGTRPVRPSVYTQAFRSTGNTAHQNTPNEEELEKEKKDLVAQEEKHFGERIKHPKKLSEKELEEIKKARPEFLVISPIHPPNYITYPVYIRIPHPTEFVLFPNFYVHDASVVVDTGAFATGIVFPDDYHGLNRAAADWKDLGGRYALSVKVDVEINGRVYKDVTISRSKKWTSARGYTKAVIGIPLMRQMVQSFVGNRVTDHDLATLPVELRQKGRATDHLGVPQHKAEISQYWDANSKARRSISYCF